MEWGFDICACYVRMHDGTSKIWDEEVSQPNLIKFETSLQECGGAKRKLLGFVDIHDDVITP
jgi:hypothetical protein